MFLILGLGHIVVTSTGVGAEQQSVVTVTDVRTEKVVYNVRPGAVGYNDQLCRDGGNGDEGQIDSEGYNCTVAICPHNHAPHNTYNTKTFGKFCLQLS